jgi:HK97 family phage major capsid protein
MNKKLLELLDAINQKKTMVKNLVDAGKLEDAAKEKEGLKELQQKFDLLKDLEDENLKNVATQLQNQAEGQPAVLTVKPEKGDGPADAIKEFADAARRGFKNTMSEGTNVDGGYTVPEDIQTKINEYREAKASLIDEVDVESVTTLKGARTYKKRTQQTGFTKVGEGGKIPGGNTPQFERLEYEISKYAGYFPVTNELLDDSDANIASTLIAWIGDESRVTRNKLILAAVDKKEKTEIAGLDDIKKALNVTLGQAFKPTSKIITNDDGLQYLDTLKDGMGRDLLQPDPTAPAKMQLRAGATVVPITVIPNADMPSDTTTQGKRTIPMIIGDLREAVKFFDRKHLTIMTSNIAAVGELNAFEEDLTLYRAIEREDVQTKDLEAIVYGTLTIDDESVVNE